MKPVDVLRAESEAIRIAEQAIESLAFERFCNVVSQLRDSGRKLIVTGVGKSAIAARKISATMATVRVPAVFIDPVGLYHGELGFIIDGDIVLMVSHSGNTDELIRLLTQLRIVGAELYSLVSDGDSPLGYLENAIITGIEHEAYLMIPTSSSAAAVAVGDAAAVTVAQMSGFGKDHLTVVHPGGNIGVRLRSSDPRKDATPMSHGFRFSDGK